MRKKDTNGWKEEEKKSKEALVKLPFLVSNTTLVKV